MDESTYVSDAAAGILHEIGQKRLSNAELEMVTDAHGRLNLPPSMWEVFAGSAAAKDAIATLNKALKGQEDVVRKAAREVLKKIKTKKS